MLILENTFSIGKRNYRYFYLFLLSLSFHCVFIFTCSLSHLILLSKQTSAQDKASVAVRPNTKAYKRFHI
jgi:hypothetical protein